MARIVVVGSGFGGVEAVRRLGQLGVCERHECLLVSPGRRFVYTPFIPMIVSGRYGLSDVVFSVEGFARRHGFSVIDDVVVGIDPSHVALRGGERLDYDYAVVAAGASPAYYNVSGAERHSVVPYSPEEALKLRETVLGGVESIVIVGAGFVGVELAGELSWLRESQGLGFSVVLIDMMELPLELLGNKLASIKARKVLERIGVRLLLGRRVKSVDERGVVLDNRERVDADVVVWVAGLHGPRMSVPKTSRDAKGFLRVDKALRVEGLGGRVYAVGDAARLEARPGCMALKMAREAIRSARVAAANILLSLYGLGPEEEYEPRITNCTPQVGLSIGPETGIVALGRTVAMESNMMNYYHERMRRIYRRLLEGGD